MEGIDLFYTIAFTVDVVLQVMLHACPCTCNLGCMQDNRNMIILRLAATRHAQGHASSP
jgi:hypothetical protein